MILADALAALDPVVVFERSFGFVPHAWQVAYLRETRPTVLLKGRQVGASLAAAALAIHRVVFTADVNVVIVSPSLRQSAEICTRARTGLRNLGVRLEQDSTSVLRLANGSRILSLPGSPKSVRGRTAGLLIVDEAAFVAPETFTAAQPLVATGGRTILQSTAGEERGAFFEAVKAADPAWAHFVVRSAEVETIASEWLASQRRAMSADNFASEFECQFGRAAAGLFKLDRLAGLILKEPNA